MSETPFHATGYGRTFYGGHVPRLVESLERLANAAERIAAAAELAAIALTSVRATTDREGGAA